jgi:hypothetical protein
MRMFCLAAEEVEANWQDFAHHLERLKEIVPNQIRESAKASRQQIWGLQDAEKVHGIAITEILATPSGLTCLIVGAAGSAPRALQERLHDEIARWAKSIGCTRMRLQGRHGWLRRLKYTQTGIVGEKVL